MFDRYELAFKQLRGFLPEECDEADEALQEVFGDIDIAKNNMLEDVYASFEGESICLFERLIDEDIDFFYNVTEENEKFIWENITMSYREKTGEILLIDKKIIFECINYHNKELSKLLFTFKDKFTYKLLSRDFEKLYVKSKTV